MAIGKAVTYITHDPTQPTRDALVLATDGKYADLLLVTADPNLQRLLPGGNWNSALERKFRVPHAATKFDELCRDRQCIADNTGSEQPAIALEDMSDCFSDGEELRFDPKAVFLPTKPAVAEKTAAAAADQTPQPPAPPVDKDPDFAEECKVKTDAELDYYAKHGQWPEKQEPIEAAETAKAEPQ